MDYANLAALLSATNSRPIKSRPIKSRPIKPKLWDGHYKVSYHTVEIQRKIKKNNREKLRRNEIRKKFKQLEKILIIPKYHIDKSTILDAAIREIIAMKKEINDLKYPKN